MFRGEGDKAFCAGGNIHFPAFYCKIKGVKGHMLKESIRDSQEQLASYYYLFYRTRKMQSLQISIWNGVAFGGGFGVSMNGAFRIATENTLLGMPEAKIGFFTDAAAAHIFLQITKSIHLSLYLALTGRKMTGKEALDLGFATHYLHSSKIPALYALLADRLHETTSYSDLKSLLDSFSDLTPSPLSLPDSDIITTIFEPDSIQGIMNRACAYRSKSAFLAEVYRELEKSCPLSLAVIFELVKRTWSQGLSVEQVIQLDVKLAAQFFESQGDFYAGVIAQIIKKDKANGVKWKHASVYEVKEAEVREFFERSEEMMLDLGGRF